MIWATPQETTGAKVPMQTRVYRLRKGLASEEIESEEINIVKAIQAAAVKASDSQLFVGLAWRHGVTGLVSTTLSRLRQAQVELGMLAGIGVHTKTTIEIQYSVLDFRLTGWDTETDRLKNHQC